MWFSRVGPQGPGYLCSAACLFLKGSDFTLGLGGSSEVLPTGERHWKSCPQQEGNQRKKNPCPGEPTSVHAGACKRLTGEQDSCVLRLFAAVPRKKGTNKFSSILRILHSCLLTKQKEASVSTLARQLFYLVRSATALDRGPF